MSRQGGFWQGLANNGAQAPFMVSTERCVFLKIAFFVNQRLIVLCRVYLLIGVDVFQAVPYISASLLLTQQTKHRFLGCFVCPKPLIFNNIQPMSVSA